MKVVNEGTFAPLVIKGHGSRLWNLSATTRLETIDGMQIPPGTTLQGLIMQNPEGKPDYGTLRVFTGKNQELCTSLSLPNKIVRLNRQRLEQCRFMNLTISD
jgi:hypothetical protein